MRLATLTVMCAALAACGPPAGLPSTTTVGETLESAATTTSQPLVVGCPTEGRFVEDGLVGDIDNTGSDATAIGLISWQPDLACETFEITFETAEGAPATTPPSVTAEFVDNIGVLRVRTSAIETVITDQLVETALVDRLYVVRSLDSGMFIDFHLAGPAQARVVLDSSPARMTLQLQPGIIDQAGSPATTDHVVLLSPTEDTEVPTTVRIEGYARTFESNVLIIATQGDTVVAEENTTAADSGDTWGEFRFDVELTTGSIVLFVGDQSAESGRFEGISIDLEVQ